MRFLKSQNINKYRRTDRTVSYDLTGHVNMNTHTTLLVPKGGTSYRPVTPQNGQIRYNTDINDMEVYAQGTWKQLRYKESVTITQQSLGYGNYTQTQFGPLNFVPAAGQNILVFVENVFQIYQVNYNITQISGNWYIVFDEAPPSKLITVLSGFDQ